MKKILILLAIVLWTSGFQSLWAWGREGHEIVALAAQAQLSEATIAALNDLRKQQINANDLVTGETFPAFKYIDSNIPLFLNNPDLDLSLIANWADGWRGSHKGTADWHFIDLDINKDETKADEDSFCHGSNLNNPRQNDCNVEQLALDMKTLGDTTQPVLDRIKALFFIVHFVGDLHQPLHCANDNDRGGNDKPVKFFNRSYNLHKIWDVDIITENRKTAKEIADGITVSDDQRSAWTQGDPGDWSLESYQIAKKKIYPAYPKDGSTPSYGQDYENEMWPIALEQLSKASVRLAYLLNKSLGSPNGSATSSQGHN